MSAVTIHFSPFVLCCALAVLSSCHGQGQTPTGNRPRESDHWLAGDTVATADGEIRGIWQDSEDNMWFASNGNGVYRYDGRTLINYTEKHGLCSNYLWMVQEGTDGNMWFKTYMRTKGGEIVVCRFDGQAFDLIQPDTNAPNDGFRDGFLLYEYYYDGATLSKIRLPETSPSKSISNRAFDYDIYAYCRDSKGNTWFGACTAGLCRYDGQTCTWFADEAMCAPIRDIFEDKNGTLWVGNNGGGLFRYDGKEFVHFSKEQHLDNPDFLTNLTGKPGTLARVWKIAQDKRGDLWVATIDSGIWRYDGKNLTNYTTADGLGTNSVWTIYFDKNDRLWVGTAEAGVYVFNGVAFEKFTNLK